MGQSMAALLKAQRQAFQLEDTPSAAKRRALLAQLREMLRAGEAELTAAVADDFGVRSAVETRLTDLFLVRAQLELAVRKLGGWMRCRRVPTPIYLWPGTSQVLPQPLGCIGVIGTWNYPIATVLAPAVCAIAAGNRVMLKPSEQSPRTSAVLARLIGECFLPEVMTCVLGGVEVAAEFAATPFDHLVFTGSGGIGRQVAIAAAANLTPVTLELGGKCPAILDPGCDLEAAVIGIAFGKFLNAGQTCVGVDYILAPRAMHAALAEALQRRFAVMFPQWPAGDDYTHIISERHFVRLRELVQDASAQGATATTLGDTTTLRGRAFPPTLLTDVHDNMRVMREEIFGPILPIVACEDREAAIAYVNARDKPLALYWFGRDRAARERVVRQTYSGGVTINGAATHVFQRNLAFGGVGASGIGEYFGEAGFRRFSKLKSIFRHGIVNPIALLSPPYTARTSRLISWMGRLL
jgi:coniferyl-aldehyde dehydrogenase